MAHYFEPLLEYKTQSLLGPNGAWGQSYEDLTGDHLECYKEYFNYLHENVADVNVLSMEDYYNKIFYPKKHPLLSKFKGGVK